MTITEPRSEPSSGTAEALSEAACHELLRTRVFGRIAVVVDGVPRVFPVNYVAEHGDLFFRTDDGMKLEAARNGAIASFEIDHADPLYHTGWSVLATGVLEDVTDARGRPGQLRLPMRTWAGTGQHVIRLRTLGISGRRVVG